MIKLPLAFLLFATPVFAQGPTDAPPVQADETALALKKQSDADRKAITALQLQQQQMAAVISALVQAQPSTQKAATKDHEAKCKAKGLKYRGLIEPVDGTGESFRLCTK